MFLCGCVWLPYVVMCHKPQFHFLSLHTPCLGSVQAAGRTHLLLLSAAQAPSTHSPRKGSEVAFSSPARPPLSSSRCVHSWNSAVSALRYIPGDVAGHKASISWHQWVSQVAFQNCCECHPLPAAHKASCLQIFLPILAVIHVSSFLPFHAIDYCLESAILLSLWLLTDLQ